jgi:hypothetical protein
VKYRLRLRTEICNAATGTGSLNLPGKIPAALEVLKNFICYTPALPDDGMTPEDAYAEALTEAENWLASFARQ